MSNGVVMCDTFDSFVDVHNVYCKCVKELWEKNHLDHVAFACERMCFTMSTL